MHLREIPIADIGGTAVGDTVCAADHFRNRGDRDNGSDVDFLRNLDRVIDLDADEDAFRGGADLWQEFVEAHDLLIVEVPTAFWKRLVFDLNRRHAALLIFANRPYDVEFITIASVSVGES